MLFFICLENLYPAILGRKVCSNCSSVFSAGWYLFSPICLFNLVNICRTGKHNDSASIVAAMFLSTRRALTNSYNYINC